jgi:chemotaxis response regulator CheB
VGIGGSAGSIEALEQFFSNLAPDTGMAFVIVRHLDPRNKDMSLMRIIPHRTLGNVIDGVVITFRDISRLKELEAALA